MGIANGPIVGTLGSGGGGGGGGITAWGQTSTAKYAGAGSPVGVVTPDAAGDLYVEEGGAHTAAHVTADSAPTLPLTIVAAVNDTFVFTGNGGGGSPETFTIAPGLYTTLAALAAAVAAATGSVSSEAFSTLVTVTHPSTELVFTMVGSSGAADNGTTITEGDGGAAAIGVTSPPDTFAGGVGPSTPALWQATGVANTDWGQVGTSGQVLAAQISIAVPGPTYGATQIAPLVPTSVQSQGTEICATAGPATAGASGSFSAAITPPGFASGALTLVYAQLDISNGAGTEKLSVATSAPVTLTSGTPYAIVFDGGSSGAVGSDLSLSGGQNTVDSAAGGQYIGTLNVNLTWAP